MESTGNWTDESRVSFSKIASAISSDKCVILKQDGSWDMVDCTQPKRVVCKRGTKLLHLIRLFSMVQ